jgi:hypothetical protein
VSELTREELRRLKLVRVQGQLVERDALHIAEKINEYDPNLYLQYLEQAEHPSEPPFRVMEICRDGIHRVAFTAWTLDDRLIQRIRAADTVYTNPSENILSLNEKIREEARTRYKEKMAEAHDITEHVIKSPKGKYTFKDPETGKLVTFE